MSTQELELSTEDNTITLPIGRAVTNRNGKVMRTEISFLPHGVNSASALRKYFRDVKGMTNAQARDAANAAVAGKQGKLQEMLATLFVQDSISSGFMPVVATENVKGDVRTIKLERKDVGARVKDAAAAAREAKDTVIANAKKAMQDAGVAPEAIEAALAAMAA